MALLIIGISGKMIQITTHNQDCYLDLIGPEKQKLLFENTARAIGGAPEEVKLRHIGNCMKADPAYGKGVADALGISI